MGATVQFANYHAQLSPRTAIRRCPTLPHGAQHARCYLHILRAVAKVHLGVVVDGEQGGGGKECNHMSFVLRKDMSSNHVCRFRPTFPRLILSLIAIWLTFDADGPDIGARRTSRGLLDSVWSF